MSIDVNKVREFFLLFSDLPEREAMRWDVVCRRATGTIESRLRQDADVEHNQERLCAAAAGWAYADYLVLGAGGVSRGDEIKVGDISVKNSSAKTNSAALDAGELRAYFLGQISDLVMHDSVLFMTTKGDKE